MFRLIALIATALVAVSCGSATQPPEIVQPRSISTPNWEEISPPGPAVEIERITGADLDACRQYRVCGTDLGIVYRRADGTFAHAFGDTFEIRDPANQVGSEGWRSPVILYSDVTQGSDEPFAFTGAANIGPNGMARSVMDNRWYTGQEHSVIPNDGISFPETGDEIISFMSIDHWHDVGESDWTTHYAGLAHSRDGQFFDRDIGPIWPNNADNTDPYQMWSMHRDGPWVYIVTTRAGRQTGPIMMMRVRWDRLLEKDAYSYWNGKRWGPQEQARPILSGRFGEPSLMKVADDLWVLSLLEYGVNPDTGELNWQIVTHTAPHPSEDWGNKKVQITEQRFPRLYGGFLRPGSTPLELDFYVSTWREHSEELDQRYDVTIFRGSV